MSNLLSMALKATENNITKGGSKRKSINDALFELLYKQAPQDKLTLVTKMSLERLENEYDGELNEETFNSEDVQKEFKRITKTVSNGFDTAVCNGKTSASFCSNKTYMDKYELRKLVDGTFTIVDKKKK